MTPKISSKGEGYPEPVAEPVASLARNAGVVNNGAGKDLTVAGAIQWITATDTFTMKCFSGWSIFRCFDT
jgi:hypothetical protein